MPTTTEDKYELEATEWIELVTNEQLNPEKSFQENLKDGTLLCKAFNGCFHDTKIKYTNSAMPFKQMENIAAFLHALSKLPNFRSFDLFSTVDLYEGKNLSQVVRTILACKRFAEKEALSKGFENLNINTSSAQEARPSVNVDSGKQSQTEETVDETHPKMNADISEDVETEVTVNEIDSECEDVKTENDEEDAAELEEETPSDHQHHHNNDQATDDPEIILIDSPLNDSRDACTLEEFEDDEIVEVFTSENPGNFEIEVSN